MAGHLLEGHTSPSPLVEEWWGDSRCFETATPHFTTRSETEHSHLRLARRKQGVSQADSLLVAHTQLFAMDLEGGGRG